MTNAVIVDGVRTPIGRYGGAFSKVRTDDLAAISLKAICERNHLDSALVEEVILGNANQAGEDNRNVARMALLLAGFPYHVAGITVNRLCASGLDAVITAYRAIKSGEGDIFIAGGVEGMSRAPFVMPKAETAFSRETQIYDTTIGWRFPNPRLQKIFPLEGMGETAENIYEQTKISRQRQDEFALESQRRAIAAINAQRFNREIVPVVLPQRKGDPIVVDTDEHPQMKKVGDIWECTTNLEKLAALPPIFRAGGSVTAGNASGINDGSACVLMMSEQKAKELGYEPLARILSAASVGVDPRVMGIGPVYATQKALQRAGLSVKDLDLIELNEAFAVQALAVVDALNLPLDRTNVNGGAIALGHPLGCSGARLTATLVHEQKHRHEAGTAVSPYGLVTLCVGVGHGVAMIVEYIGS